MEESPILETDISWRLSPRHKRDIWIKTVRMFFLVWSTKAFDALHQIVVVDWLDSDDRPGSTIADIWEDLRQAKEEDCDVSKKCLQMAEQELRILRDLVFIRNELHTQLSTNVVGIIYES